jgi:hypothetical protein
MPHLDLVQTHHRPPQCFQRAMPGQFRVGPLIDAAGLSIRGGAALQRLACVAAQTGFVAGRDLVGVEIVAHYGLVTKDAARSSAANSSTLSALLRRSRKCYLARVWL